jgi:hypothetical protein
MKRNVVTIAAVAIVAVLCIWGYSAYRAHTTRAAIVALVTDAGERLRAALPIDGQADFEAAARAAEAHVARLRKLDTGSMLPLADAADGYLVTAREILKRRAAIHSVRERVTKELDALTQHVQSDRGRADWPQQAVRLRDELDRDFREYRIATESYAELLETLPGAQAKIAGHVKTMWTADEKTVRDARAAALDALARTDENIRKLTQLDAYRGMRRQKGSR